MNESYKVIVKIDCATNTGGRSIIPIDSILTEKELLNEPLYYKLFTVDSGKKKALVLLTLAQIISHCIKIEN